VGLTWHHNSIKSEYRYHSALDQFTLLQVDDFLCFSHIDEEHMRHLRQICVTLKQHHMYLNFNKIETCQPDLTYLGNCVGWCGIQPTADRAQGSLKIWLELENMAGAWKYGLSLKIYQSSNLSGLARGFEVLHRGHGPNRIEVEPVAQESLKDTAELGRRTIVGAWQ